MEKLRQLEQDRSELEAEMREADQKLLGLAAQGMRLHFLPFFLPSVPYALNFLFNYPV